MVKKVLILFLLAISFASYSQVEFVQNMGDSTGVGTSRVAKIAKVKATEINTLTAAGTDTYTATISSTITELVTGQAYTVIFTNANTGAATLTLTGATTFSAVPLKKNKSSALAANDIKAGGACHIIYDGTNFQIMGNIAAAGGGGDLLSTNNLSDVANAGTSRTNLGLGNVTNESKATMFTNSTFTGTFNVADASIANADLANGAVANLSGTNTGDQTISDATISTTDITTNNFTTAKHGFVPKGTNVGNFLKDDGTWASPSGSGDMVLASVQTVTGAKTFGTIGGAVGKLILAGSTSGSTILNANAVAGSGTVVLPTTGTLSTLDGSETLTNKIQYNTISPSQITSAQDNWNPSGLDDATTIRLSGDASIRSITSITAPTTTYKPQRKTLINIGGSPIYIPSEHPDGTAANRFIHPRDFILHPYKSCVIDYDITSSRWRIISGDESPANNSLYYTWSASSVTAGDHGAMTFLTIGTGTNTATISTTSLPASQLFSTAASATAGWLSYFSKSVASYSAFGTAHQFAEAFISIPTTSSSSERFISYLQLTNNPASTTAEVNNQIGFRYSDNINSGAWELYTQDNAGAESVANTGVTVAAGTLYKLRVEINKTRNEVRGYINDLYVGRITGNMPSAVVNGSRVLLVKTVGTTARTMAVHSVSAGAIHSY